MSSRNWRVPADLKLLAGAKRMVLRKIGYWRSDREPNLPDPRALVQPGCYGANLPCVLDYLRGGQNYVADLLECEEFDEKTQLDLSFWTTWASQKTARRSSVGSVIPILRKIRLWKSRA
jgi:hypothetical protein